MSFDHLLRLSSVFLYQLFTYFKCKNKKKIIKKIYMNQPLFSIVVDDPHNSRKIDKNIKKLLAGNDTNKDNDNTF